MFYGRLTVSIERAVHFCVFVTAKQQRWQCVLFKHRKKCLPKTVFSGDFSTPCCRQWVGNLRLVKKPNGFVLWTHRPTEEVGYRRGWPFAVLFFSDCTSLSMVSVMTHRCTGAFLAALTALAGIPCSTCGPHLGRRVAHETSYRPLSRHLHRILAKTTP